MPKRFTSGSTVAPGRVAVPGVLSSCSYPGGKSGAGIYQRLINLIPRHQILISAFAGHCGVVRKIRPAEQTIVIDADERVCEWWSSWSRSKQGRSLEIHHCDGIEWLRHRFELTEYSACGSSDVRSHGTGSRNEVARGENRGSRTATRGKSHESASLPAVTLDTSYAPIDASLRVAAEPPISASEAFLFCDPPYVLSERSHGKLYAHELCDDGHRRLLEVLTQIHATSAAKVLLCGYESPIYATLERWRSIDHRVPTRGGLQDERIWMNYAEPKVLHDHRFLGETRRQRERIRRRQINWLSQLNAMGDRERAAMLEVLTGDVNFKSQISNLKSEARD